MKFCYKWNIKTLHFINLVRACMLDIGLKIVLSKVVSLIGNYQLLIWIDSLVTRFIVFECSVFNWLKEIQINIEMQFSISLHKLTVRSTNTCYFEGPSPMRESSAFRVAKITTTHCHTKEHSKCFNADNNYQ